MTSNQNIAVVGAGAMGAIYASKFYDMDPGCVTLVAGGERYERLMESGLIVNNKTYRIPVVRPEEDFGPSDFILVAVKHHQLPDAIVDLRNQVGEHSHILSVMNGIDSEEQIGAAYGIDKLVYAIAIGIDAVREGNEITYTSSGRIIFGEKENKSLSERVQRIQAILDSADIAHETPEDMVRMLWWKFMVNVGLNPLTAILRGTYGIFQKSQHARDLLVAAMEEVVTLAKAVGVNLNIQDIDDWFPVMAQMSPAGKTSMLQDVEACRKTEVEMFAGRMMELGKIHDISTPINDMMFKLIRVLEETYFDVE